MEILVFTHGIKKIPNYVFSGEELYVLSNCKYKRTQRLKILKKQFVGRNRMCRGYYIDRKFRSLTWIEKRRYPLTKIFLVGGGDCCPF